MPDMPNSTRLLAAAVLAVAGLAGCTKESDAGGADAAAVPDTEAHFVDWYGKAAEVAHACNHASSLADASLDGHGALDEAEDHSLEVVMASGQAVEYCSFALDGDTALVPAEELNALWGDGTETFAAWLDAMAETNRSAVIVAAGNADSLPLVGELYHRKGETDELADRVDALIAAQAESLGLETPHGLDLYRWDPPGH
jgi:hypothetical protein